LERSQEDDIEEEDSSNTSADKNTSEKKATDMSDMSDLNGQIKTSVQENVVVSDHNLSSNIACDMPSNPILEPKKPENAPSSLTRSDKSVADSSRTMLLKCPHCNFKNIHQESIDHHIMYKHNNNNGEEEQGELTTG
jgi:hypothetical protein